MSHKKLNTYQGWRRKIALLLVLALFLTMFPEAFFVETFTQTEIVQTVKADEPPTPDEWDGTYPSAGAAPWEQGPGDGTADNPYQITSAAMLAQFSVNVSSGEKYDRVYFILTTDIDLKGWSWIPIGYSTSESVNSNDEYIYVCYSFNGSFDGDGHSIIGLNVDDPDKRYKHAGLFAKLGEQFNSIAEIKSLNVSGSVESNFVKLQGRVNGDVTNVDEVSVGGIVAYLYRSTIRNCSVNVTVLAPYEGYSEREYGYGYNKANLGGVVGTIYNGGTLVNCVTVGTVSGPASYAALQYNQFMYNVGGLVGKIDTLYDMTITNCYALGNVAGPTNSNNNSYIGGFLGRYVSYARYGKLKLENCYWNSAATQQRGNSDKEKYGYGQSDIATLKTNLERSLYPLTEAQKDSPLILDVLNGFSGLKDFCWEQVNDVPVLTKGENANPHYGLSEGVFDLNGGDGTAEQPYTISEPFQMILLSYWCNQTAGFMAGKQIQLKADLDVESLLLSPIGADASHSFEGKFDGNGHTISGLNVQGINTSNTYVGLFGYVGIAGEISALVIKGEVNPGSFFETTLPDNIIIGGIAGYLEGTIKNCFADIEVTASVADYAGGMIGSARGATIVNCFSKGTVTYTKKAKNTNYCGGFVGYDEGSYYANCYALADIKQFEAAVSGMFAGAMVEYSSNLSTVRNCLWDANVQLMKEDGDASTKQKVGVGSSASTASVPAAASSDLQSQEAIELLNACSGLTDYVWVNTSEYNHAGYPCLIAGTNPFADLPLGFCDAGDGDGTKAKPYTISTPLQLQILGYKSELEHSQLQGKYVQLANDIDLENANFTPIAAGRSDGMNYIFDGAGNAITGLKVNGFYQSAGLFAGTDTNGVIQNLSVKGTVTNLFTSASNTGGIVGSNHGTLKNSNTEVSIDHQGTGASGGLVGSNSSSGVISASYSLGAVAAATGTAVGGLVGTNDGAIQISFWNKDGVQKVNQVVQSPARGIGNQIGDAIAVTPSELKSTAVLNIMNACGEMNHESWQINGTKNNGYPYQSAVPNPYASWVDGVFSDGDGSVDNPYTIETKEQLYALAAKVSRGEDYCTKYIQLANNINVSGLPFLPIGTDASIGFLGDFNGQGYTISGLTIERTGANTGLFGYVGKAGVIRCLNVSGSVQCINVDSNVGGIVGLLSSATMSGCSFRGSVIGGKNANIGGLIGMLEKSSFVKGSYASANFIGGTGASIGGAIGAGNAAATLAGVVWCSPLGKAQVGIGNGVGEVNVSTATDLKTTATCKILNEGLNSREIYWGQAGSTNDGFPYLKEKEELGGMVSITGSFIFDELLIANTDGLTKAADAGEWNYQWTRDGSEIEGADAEDYTLAQADIGTVINVTMWADNSKAKSSAQTETVAKGLQFCSVQPLSTRAVTSTMIVLEPIAGIEFCIEGIEEWVSIPIFTGLSANTEYRFLIRKAETDTHDTSTPVPALAPIQTAAYSDAKYEQDAPDAPTILNQTTTQVTLVSIENAEYSIDAVTWQSSECFDNLTPGATYVFYARYQENKTHYYSEPSSSLTVTLNKQSQSTPSAPMLVSKTSNTIVLKQNDGMQYRIGSDGAWQESSTFIGLKADTQYQFYVRGAETATSYASAASAVLTVRTDQATSALKTYRITFDLNGAKGTAPAAQSVQQGKGVTSPKAPKRSGYIFKGWYQEKACKTKWQFAGNLASTDITLYAGWVKIPGKTKLTVTGEYKSVKLTWKKVAGANGYQIYRATSKNGKYTKIKTITSGNTVSFTNKKLTVGKTYYYKIRAYVKVDGKQKVGSYCVIKKVKVPDLKKITFKANGGTTVKAKYVKNNSKLSAPTKPLRKGYTFAGWYTNASKTKKYDFKTKVAKNFKLYAKWTPNWKNPPEVACLTSKNQVRLIWDEIEGVSGYEIVRRSDNEKMVIDWTEGQDGVVIYTDGDVEKGQTYSYQVRAYKLVKGKKVYGKYSVAVQFEK